MEYTMSYEASWKQAKKDFETATGRKKPSETFLGVFRKGSGVESAAKELDKAIAKGNPDGIRKAVEALAKASKDYVALLRAAAKDSKNKDVERDIDDLRQTFDTWGVRADETANHAAKLAMLDDLKDEIAAWEKSYEKQTAAVNRLVTAGRNAIGAVRDAVADLLETAAANDKDGQKRAEDGIKQGRADIEEAIKKLEAAYAASSKTFALLPQKFKLTGEAKASATGRTVTNCENLLSVLKGVIDGLDEDLKALDVDIKQARGDASKSGTSIEKRVVAARKVFSSWVDRNSDMNTNTNSMEGAIKQAEKEAVVWTSGGRVDTRQEARIRGGIEEVEDRAPALHQQLVALNRKMLEYRVAPELLNDADLKKEFGPDKAQLFDENENNMKRLDDYLARAASLKKRAGF
jgi:hypothetical protein